MVVFVVFDKLLKFVDHLGGFIFGTLAEAGFEDFIAMIGEGQRQARAGLRFAAMLELDVEVGPIAVAAIAEFADLLRLSLKRLSRV